MLNKLSIAVLFFILLTDLSVPIIGQLQYPNAQKLDRIHILRPQGPFKQENVIAFNPEYSTQQSQPSNGQSLSACSLYNSPECRTSSVLPTLNNRQQLFGNTHTRITPEPQGNSKGNSQKPENSYPETYPQPDTSTQSKPSSFHPVIHFSLNLLKNIPTSSNDNLIISPISAQILLSTLGKGARGETKRQLQIATGTKTGEELYKVLYIDSSGLQSVLGVFCDNKVTLKNDFMQKTANLATVSNIDFTSPYAKPTINQWVSNYTHGNIRNLIPADYNLNNAKLVLVSAIYFKNLWKYKFHPIGNKEFENGNGKRPLIPFMEITQNIPIHEINIDKIKLTAISVPYQNPKYAMIFLLPSANVGLDNIIANLNSVMFEDILKELEERYPKYVKLQIPKFKVASSQSLVQPLQNMGVLDIFDEYSDLRDMTSTPNLIVNEILQKATLDVDEKGTVAAAATSSILIPLIAGSKPEPRLFVVDKPFLVIILDTEYKTPLFIGKINSPKY